MNKKWKTLLLAAILTVAATIVAVLLKGKGIYTIQSDGRSYYEYFQRMFINHNLAGSGMIKYPIGTMLLQLPFLLIAYGWSSVFGINLEGGLSFMFQYAVLVSALFWSFLALCLLYRWLNGKVSRLAAFLSCLSLLLGTMLPVYITDRASFSHAYAFFTCTAFWAYVPWYESVRGKTAFTRGFLMDLALGALLGLCAIVRNTNVIIGATYLFYGVCSLKSFGERLRGKVFTARLIPQIAGALAIYGIQMIAWRIMAGRWILYSYAGESFTNLAHPHILRVLFSDAKGLFVFCPILFVAIVSLAFFQKENKDFCLAQWSIFAVETLIIGAWWCWWLGTAYGERLFCDVLCIFALPLAVYFDKLHEWLEDLFYEKNVSMYWVPCLGYAFACLFIILNLTIIRGVYKDKVNDNFATWFELKTWLSYCVLKSGAVPKLNEVPLDIWFYGHNYNAHHYISGIYQPEQHGSWTSGTHMDVEIPVRSSCMEYDVRIVVRKPFFGRQHWIARQKDAIIGQGALESAGDVIFSAAVANGRLAFSIEFPDAKRPSEVYSDSGDYRKLAMQIERIRIGPHKVK